jgi:hypothetical protein
MKGIKERKKVSKKWVRDEDMREITRIFPTRLNLCMH